MKTVRLEARPDPEVAPRPFGLIANSPFVEVTRLLAWNVAQAGRVTGLLDLRGDGDRLARALRAEPPVARVSRTRIGSRRHALLVAIDLAAISVVQKVFESLTEGAVIVDKPVIYRDGAVQVRLVGTDEAVQAAVDGLPTFVAVTVQAVGEYHPDAGLLLEALSERQRDALEAALALGYYDHSRRATHADVADRLDCAPSTASEHLKRAESKLVRAALADGTAAPRNE